MEAGNRKERKEHKGKRFLGEEKNRTDRTDAPTLRPSCASLGAVP